MYSNCGQQIYNPYYPGGGPYPGKPMGVPVPMGSLKETSDAYRYSFYASRKPLPPHDYFRPYGPNHPEIQHTIKYADTPCMPHFSSVNAFVPLPEVQSPWEKIGILTTTNESDNSILNLYRRVIAPYQDVFEYSVQDKDGFIIRLPNSKYLEDEDIIPQVIGKEGLGSWKVHKFVKNKYVWV